MCACVPKQLDIPMNRNTMLVVVGIVCLVIGAGGYWIYQDQNRGGVELSVGGNSVRIR